MGHGEDEKARRVLARYHSDGDENSGIVRLQMKEMKEVIEVENGTDKRYRWNICVSMTQLMSGHRQMVGHTWSLADEVRSSPILPRHLHRLLRPVGPATDQLLLPAHGQFFLKTSSKHHQYGLLLMCSPAG